MIGHPFMDLFSGHTIRKAIARRSILMKNILAIPNLEKTTEDLVSKFLNVNPTIGNLFRSALYKLFTEKRLTAEQMVRLFSFILTENIPQSQLEAFDTMPHRYEMWCALSSSPKATWRVIYAGHLDDEDPSNLTGLLKRLLTLSEEKLDDELNSLEPEPSKNVRNARNAGRKKKERADQDFVTREKLFENLLKHRTFFHHSTGASSIPPNLVFQLLFADSSQLSIVEKLLDRDSLDYVLIWVTDPSRVSRIFQVCWRLAPNASTLLIL